MREAEGCRRQCPHGCILTADESCAAGLSHAVAEAPIVFLEKKPETPQAFKFQGMAPERPFLRPLEGSSGVPFKVPASEEWMEDKAMHAGPLGELAEGQQQRQQLPRSSSTHALHGGRGSSLEPGLERHEAFIVSSAGSRAVDIGRLRDVPLQELGLSSALLLRVRSACLLRASSSTPNRCCPLQMLSSFACSPALTKNTSSG